MKALFKYWLRIFLIFLLVPSLLQGFDGFSQPFDWTGGLTFGLFMGITMASMFTSWQVEGLKGIGINNIEYEHMAVEHSDFVNSPLDLISLFQLLEKDHRFKSYQLSSRDSEIKIRSRMSGFSWGEIIKVRQTDFDGNAYKYEIESRPRFPALADGARNLSNVLYISRLINQQTTEPLQMLRTS